MLGVFLAIIGALNAYHFANVTQPGNAVLATISAIAGGVIIGTATTQNRFRQLNAQRDQNKRVK